MAIEDSGESKTKNGVQELHCKKRLATFPSPAGMSLTKLSLPAGTGMSLTFFDGVEGGNK